MIIVTRRSSLRHTDMLKQFENLHHVQVPVSVGGVSEAEQIPGREPERDYWDDQEVKHTKYDDDEEVFQDGLELCPLPDQDYCEEADSEYHRQQHEEYTKLVVGARDLIQLKLCHFLSVLIKANPKIIQLKFIRLIIS